MRLVRLWFFVRHKYLDRHSNFYGNRAKEELKLLLENVVEKKTTEICYEKMNTKSEQQIA